MCHWMQYSIDVNIQADKQTFEVLPVTNGQD